MIKSEKLDELCIRLAEAKPNWDAIVGKYTSHQLYDSNKALFPFQYEMYFSEIHLDRSLRELAKDPSMALDVGIAPGKHFEYKLNTNTRSNLFITKKGEPLAEFDAFALVDDKPVVFELKTGGWNDGNNGIAEYLKTRFYEKRKLLATIIGAEAVGSVLIVPKNIYETRSNNKNHVPNSRWNQFLAQGGKIVPFYTTSDKFKEDVLTAVEKYNLKLKISESN